MGYRRRHNRTSDRAHRARPREGSRTVPGGRRGAGGRQMPHALPRALPHALPHALAAAKCGACTSSGRALRLGAAGLSQGRGARVERPSHRAPSHGPRLLKPAACPTQPDCAAPAARPRPRLRQPCQDLEASGREGRQVGVLLQPLHHRYIAVTSPLHHRYITVTGGSLTPSSSCRA